MNKNTKHIFLLTTLLVLLVGLTAISASDVSDNTTADNTVSHVTTQDTSSVEPVQTTDNKISDNKKVQTTTKTIESKQKTVKKDTQINYYVSDSNGSDSNDGSNNKPYKTIQKAINGTTQDNTYNIHIKAGNYTGTGNTNLTVNGNYHINFIGEGINKTVIDGEVKYSVGNASVWGEDDYWNSYIISYGNWGMNITTGNGHITISNMRFQYMYTAGGSRMDLNPGGAITNYANLDINNVLFYRNMGGVGASIYNKADAILNVNNSTFRENRKGTSTGCLGTGIYNNGTAIVNNSQFIKNAARWGTISNDHVLNISNSIIRDGISYDLASTYKSGSGISSNTGDNDYWNLYHMEGVNTNIQNCTFINNGQLDVQMGFEGNLIVNNSVFNHSTGIAIYSDSNSTNVISNNQLIDMQPSSLLGDLSGENKITFGIYKVYNGYINNYVANTTTSSIVNNTISLSDDGYAIKVNRNIYLANNTLNHRIDIDGPANIVENNRIVTDDSYAVNVGTRMAAEFRSENNTITGNYLISRNGYGDSAVSTAFKSYSNNTIANNTPRSEAKTITITNVNYNQYFDNDGRIINGTIPIGSTLILRSPTNKTFIINTRIIIQGTTSNSSIIVTPNGRITANSLTINNVNSTQPAIILNSTYNTLTRASITVNTIHQVDAVVINGNYNTITNGFIRLTSPGGSTGLLVTSNNNTFKSNEVTVRSRTNSQNKTIGVNILNNDTQPLFNNCIQATKISVTSNNSIGLNLHNAYNNTLRTVSTTITVTGSNITAINITGNAVNTNITCTYYVYGNGYGIVVNNANITHSIFNARPNTRASYSNITFYKINNADNITIRPSGSITSSNSTMYELSNISNSLICNNKIDIRASNVIFFNVNNLTNNTMNNIQVTGQANRPYIITITNSSNNLLNASNFTYVNSINLINSTNNTIINNYITSPHEYGNDVVLNKEGNIVENNTPISLTITNSTYNTLFDKEGNFIYNSSFDVLRLGSNLYGVDLKFNQTVNFINLANYTVYNGTIEITSNDTKTSTINGININNTQKVVLIINSQTNINNINITVNNTNTTALILNSRINFNNVNMIINIVNATAIISNNRFDANYMNMIVTGGNITLINNTNTNTYIAYSNITINTDKVILFNTTNTSIRIKNNNIIINTTDKATLINANNNTDMIINTNNITQNAKTNTIIQATNSAITNSDGSSTSGFTGNNITLNGEEVQIIDITNKTSGTSLPTNIRDNNIKINTTNSKILITIDGTNNHVIGNNITVNTKQNNTPVINIANATNSEVTNNYIKTNDMEGDNAVNHTGILIQFNTPGVKITDDNYNQYFTNGIINPTITSIELGADIHNKNMIFNTPVLVRNPNNYTIYNGTLTFNKEANGSNIIGLNINNTDDRTSTIIIYSNTTNLLNNNIYQENTNNKAEVIIYDNILANDEYNEGISRINITNNTITVKAPSITAINITSTTNLTTYHRGDAMGGKWYNVTNETAFLKLFIQNNNITLTSTNPSVAITIGNTKTIYMRNNKIIADTYNNNTPLIEVYKVSRDSSYENSISNNYIEARDIYGFNAINATSSAGVSRTTNTPTNTTRAININITTPNETYANNTYPITINIENMFKEAVNGTIIIKIDNQTITQNLINGQATLNYTPTSGNHTITITYNGTNTTYNTNTTSIQINTQKYNTTTTILNITTIIEDTTQFTATVIDMNGNNVLNGRVTFTVNGTELTDKNGNVIYADVINGQATLNYKVPYEWLNINNTGVNYLGNDVYESSNNTGYITVNRKTVNMKLEILNNKIRPGETAIIMVTVTDKNGNMVKSGKVIFKLNGKTIKDTNGSTITVRIHNGIAIFKYIVPANYSAKNYTLTAVSVGNTYNRVEAITNLTLTKINTYIQNVNTYFNGNTLHVQANIISTSTQENVAYRETKVSIKINNKTFAKEVKITNGTINLNIDTSTIGRGNYKITIKAGENGIYNGSQLDTYTYKAPVKSALNQTSNNGTLVKA